MQKKHNVKVTFFSTFDMEIMWDLGEEELNMNNVHIKMLKNSSIDRIKLKKKVKIRYLYQDIFCNLYLYINKTIKMQKYKSAKIWVFLKWNSSSKFKFIIPNKLEWKWKYGECLSVFFSVCECSSNSKNC